MRLSPSVFYVPASVTIIASLVIVSDVKAEKVSDNSINLLKCMDIKNNADRLNCYDNKAAEMRRALNSNQTSQADADARADAADPWAPPRKKEKVAGAEELKPLETEIQSVMPGPDGNWILMLKRGGLWRQTDGIALAHAPQPGDRVTVMRAALGSYKMRIAGQSAVRVRRLN